MADYFTGDLSEVPGWGFGPTDNPARADFGEGQGFVDTGSFDTSGGGSGNLLGLSGGDFTKAAGAFKDLGAATKSDPGRPTQQQYGQSQLDTQGGVWQEAQNWPVQNLDILLSALTGTPYPTTTQGYAPQQQPTSNVGGQILGGLGTAAGIGANVFKMFGI